MMNPVKLACQPLEGCLACPSENQQPPALCWGLACACPGTVQYSQGTVVEAGTQTAFEDTRAEIQMQTTTTVTAEEEGGGESGREESDQASPSTKKLKKVVRQFKEKVGDYAVPDFIRIL